LLVEAGALTAAVDGEELLVEAGTLAAAELADVRVIKVYVTAPAIIKTASTQSAIFHHCMFLLVISAPFV
jgi:hypothetical protein